MAFSCIELCAGGGGQALGLEQAGFQHLALFDNNADACATLRLNRGGWEVAQADIRELDGAPFRGVGLLAAGLPCPPFSVAGQQLGQDDERDLFPAALRLIEESRPQAIMIENVRGLLESRFEPYRQLILNQLRRMGYRADWRLLDAADFGVSQYRRRAILVGLRQEAAHCFAWPEPEPDAPPTVGDRLYDQIAARGWRLARRWRAGANGLAPTIVGGSMKHGGPDLGPVRARKAWALLGVDGKGVADAPPAPESGPMPRLTVPMVARLQGFPDDWRFSGSKTSAYKQVGNAFPPPVAVRVGRRLLAALADSSPRYVPAWASQR